MTDTYAGLPVRRGLYQCSDWQRMAEDLMAFQDAVQEALKTESAEHVLPAIARLKATNNAGTWRVMYICRQGVDQPDEDMGRHDFATEAEARAYFDSDEVTSRLNEYWRAELRVQPPWTTVDSYDYADQETR